MESKRLVVIDFLRAFAIFLIVLFHLLMILWEDNRLKSIGFVGVSLFFIISGFLLTKKYPNLTKFNIKWFLKRFIRISAIYYPTLVLFVLLFGRQIYWGNTTLQLIYHFLFADFLNKRFAYSIISSAWFLTPLLTLYLFFPYINKYIKKYNWMIILAFGLMIYTRSFGGALSPYSPLFFLGEFCFGISFAYNNKKLPLLLSIIFIFLEPYMVLPFFIFYFATLINPKHLPKKALSFIGAITFEIFLFHEAFIEVIIGNWNIYGFGIIISFIILLIGTAMVLLFSKAIKKLFNKLLINHNKP